MSNDAVAEGIELTARCCVGGSIVAIDDDARCVLRHHTRTHSCKIDAAVNDEVLALYAPEDSREILLIKQSIISLPWTNTHVVTFCEAVEVQQLIV